MRRGYYFLTCCLPDLVGEENLLMTASDLTTLMRANLTYTDYEQYLQLQLLFEILPMERVVVEECSSFGSRYSWNKLKSSLEHLESPSSWVSELIEEMRHLPATEFSSFLYQFLREQSARNQGCLRRIFTFELYWRQLVDALREAYAQGNCNEFKNDANVRAHMLDPNLFDEVGISCHFLVNVYLNHMHEPIKQHEVLQQWRCSALEMVAMPDLFTIDWILSYSYRFFIQTEIKNAEAQMRGKQVLEELLQCL